MCATSPMWTTRSTRPRWPASRLGAPGTLEALIRERTEETIGWYHADMDALGAAAPDHEPRATDYIAQMIAMIEG
jgi:cysteinyl-tRNA synthetase